MKWLYKLEEDYRCDLSLYISEDELVRFKNEVQQDRDFCDRGDPPTLRLRITKEGEIIVFQGYSWDGNSPKINVFDLFWFGTPDGLMTNNKPIAYYPSLIHDVLGQFKRYPQMPAKFRSDKKYDLWLSQGRRGRDGLYFSMLKQKGFIWRHLYYLAVFLFGPLNELYLALAKHVRFDP